MVAQISHREIVRELKAGEPAGCRHLMDLYHDRLLGEAAEVFHIPFSDAEELVSDVLMTVIEKIEAFEFKKREGDFHFWVMTIFRNRVRDRVRHLAATGGLTVSFQESALDDEEEFSGVEKEVAVAIVRNYEEVMAGERGEGTEVASRLNAIEEVLDGMETWERVLLRCRALEVPYEDIAQYTGKTVKQLKVYHARVKKKFARQLVLKFPELAERSV